MIGPVQVVVVGFEHPTFSGDVLAEFTRLRSAGIVRLVDLLLVSRTEDGTIQTVDALDGAPADLGGLAAALLGKSEDGDVSNESRQSSNGSTWSLTDAIPAGGTAAVALIEHTWAAPLREAIRRTGGTPLDETWLAREDVELLQALIAERKS